MARPARYISAKQTLLRYAGNFWLILGLYIGNFIFCTWAFTLWEKKSILDAIWWCTVTWFTVGYGDLYPTTPKGKLFTVFAIVSSHALIILLTANFITHLSHARVRQTLCDRCENELDDEEETDVAAIIS